MLALSAFEHLIERCWLSGVTLVAQCLRDVCDGNLALAEGHEIGKLVALTDTRVAFIACSGVVESPRRRQIVHQQLVHPDYPPESVVSRARQLRRRFALPDPLPVITFRQLTALRVPPTTLCAIIGCVVRGRPLTFVAHHRGLPLTTSLSHLIRSVDH